MGRGGGGLALAWVRAGCSSLTDDEEVQARRDEVRKVARTGGGRGSGIEVGAIFVYL